MNGHEAHLSILLTAFFVGCASDPMVTDMLVPKGENMSFGFAGIGSSSSGAGGFSSEKRPEDRISRGETLFRFKIHEGKIKAWYAARILDGRTGQVLWAIRTGQRAGLRGRFLASWRLGVLALIPAPQLQR